MTQQPQEQQQIGGSRKASIMAWIMMAIPAIILGLSGLIATQAGLAVAMIIIMVSFVVFSAGSIMLMKYGRRRVCGAGGFKYPLNGSLQVWVW